MTLPPIMRLTDRASHVASAHVASATQTVARTAMHRSTPTDQAVTAPPPIGQDCGSRQPSRHTFDIRV